MRGIFRALRLGFVGAIAVKFGCWIWDRFLGCGLDKLYDILKNKFARH